MNKVETELFEEFKSVDSICRDMYSAQYGVTAYIEHMEMTPMSVRYKVAGWENDHKTLKHIRWVRNQLAHENGYVECTDADVNWLRDFHSRLLNQTDPLAEAHRISEKPQQQKSQPHAPRLTVTPNPNTNRQQQSAPYIYVTAFAAAVVVLVLLLFMIK